MNVKFKQQQNHFTMALNYITDYSVTVLRFSSLHTLTFSTVSLIQQAVLRQTSHFLQRRRLLRNMLKQWFSNFFLKCASKRRFEKQRAMSRQCDVGDVQPVKVFQRQARPMSRSWAWVLLTQRKGYHACCALCVK